MDTTKVMLAISDLKLVSARHFLEEAGIKCFVIDKRDTAYGHLPGMGLMELYVDKEKESLALKILEENGMLEEASE